MRTLKELDADLNQMGEGTVESIVELGTKLSATMKHCDDLRTDFTKLQEQHNDIRTSLSKFAYQMGGVAAEGVNPDAVPDLLAACEAVVETSAKADGVGRTFGYIDCQTGAIDKCGTAIAKAKPKG